MEWWCRGSCLRIQQSIEASSWSPGGPQTGWAERASRCPWTLQSGEERERERDGERGERGEKELYIQRVIQRVLHSILILICCTSFYSELHLKESLTLKHHHATKIRYQSIHSLRGRRCLFPQGRPVWTAVCPSQRHPSSSTLSRGRRPAWLPAPLCQHQPGMKRRGRGETGEGDRRVRMRGNKTLLRTQPWSVKMSFSTATETDRKSVV